MQLIRAQAAWLIDALELIDARLNHTSRQISSAVAVLAVD